MGRMIMIMRVFSLMTNTMVGMKKTQSCTVSRNNDHPEHDADMAIIGSGSSAREGRG